MMKIIICGGGIGGLTAALCLARTGHQITLLEQAPAFEEVGAGLQVSPNGMKVLRALGLEDELAKLAFEPEQIELRFGVSGQVIFDIPLREKAKSRWGAPYFHLHRADLLGVLLAAAKARPDIQIATDARIEGYTVQGDRVTVELTDGRLIGGDLLIGADGLHSVVRGQMLGADAPVFTGCVAWRGVVDIERLDVPPPPTACAWVGRGKHAVTYRLRGGSLANFVGIVERDDWTKESWSAEGARAEIASDFAGWDPVISELIQKGDQFFQWGLFGRAPLMHWHDGPVVLLGDACHPMLPFLAQGAVMAIEDAWVLSKCLSGSGALTDRLQAYQNARLARTTKVQARSRQNATTFHHRSDIARLLNYGPMWIGARLLPDVVHARMDWIYGFDVTAD